MATTTALSWAVLAIVLKYSLHFFSAGTIVWMRMVLAFFILFAGYLWYRPSALQILWKPPSLGLLAGLLISINYFGFMKGIELTSASNAQVMIQLAPMGFVVLSILVLKERPTLTQRLGMLTALMGFAFFFWDQILVSVDRLAAFKTGNVWIVVGALSWSIFALFQKILIRKYQAQQFNLLIYGLSALCLLPMANVGELLPFTWLKLGLLVFLSVNTVVAYGAFSEALKRIPGSHVSMIISLNPLLTLAIMTYLTQIEVEWIHGEPIHWRGFLGALLVVIGVITTVASRPALSPQQSSS